MKIVIVGAGSVGFQLANNLIEENNDVVLIEKDADRAKYAMNSLDCLVINGEGNNPEILKEAGINKAEFFISVTDSDEVNMIVCGLVSSEFMVPYKIARVRKVDYSGRFMLQKSFLGIDYIVNPEIEAARAITRIIDYGAVSDIMLFEETKSQMRNITVRNGSLLVNRSIEEIKHLIEEEFLIALILRDNDYIIPSGDMVIRENDKLYLIATDDSFERIFNILGRKKMKLNKILLAGGGKVGYHIASHLLQKNDETNVLSKISGFFTKKQRRRITIIDKNYEKCKFLSEQFPGAMVINSDISDENLFEDAQLANYDSIVAATDNEELNLVTAIYAKTRGIKRTIALVKKNSYVHIGTDLGIDVTISQKTSVVNTILKFIRRGNIKSVHSLSGGMVEVIEFSVENGSKADGKTIKELKLPYHTLIVSITRGKESIIPSGDHTIRSGDNLIVIAKKEHMKKVEDLFTIPT
ncbi:MAG: Trk system potassium transporter TrkA [Spirochaetes bacterium]|nr:MAG: Trk system potassium transporter TrkA [Spirochaetota bacterium]